jgi:hypothetical protein
MALLRNAREARADESPATNVSFNQVMRTFRHASLPNVYANVVGSAALQNPGTSPNGVNRASVLPLADSVPIAETKGGTTAEDAFPYKKGRRLSVLTNNRVQRINTWPPQRQRLKRVVVGWAGK